MSTKSGDVIRVVAEQDDANGDLLSRVTVEWFGFENAAANAATMQLVEVVAKTADGWRIEKAGGEGKPPGAIR